MTSLAETERDKKLWNLCEGEWRGGVERSWHSLRKPSETRISGISVKGEGEEAVSMTIPKHVCCASVCHPKGTNANAADNAICIVELRCGAALSFASMKRETKL